MGERVRGPGRRRIETRVATDRGREEATQEEGGQEEDEHDEQRRLPAG
jgi:hypothetical protein